MIYYGYIIGKVVTKLSMLNQVDNANFEEDDNFDSWILKRINSPS